MGRPRGELPEAIGRVRKEIEKWRRTRTKRSPMPARLWERATELAKTHGAYRSSQALGLSYDSLRSRMKSSKESSETTGFVELGGGELIHAGSPCVEVEMSKADGSRMTVRVSGLSGSDVISIVEGFWSRAG